MPGRCSFRADDSVASGRADLGRFDDELFPRLGEQRKDGDGDGEFEQGEDRKEESHGKEPQACQQGEDGEQGSQGGADGTDQAGVCRLDRAAADGAATGKSTDA
jgi:hypothetical protein